MQRRCILDEFLGRLGGSHDRLVISVAFNSKANDRLAGCRNSIDDTLCPTIFNTNYDNCGDVWIGASTNQGLEVQIKIGTKLQAAIGMWDCEGSLDRLGDRL